MFLFLGLIFLLFFNGASRDYSGGHLITGTVPDNADTITSGAWINLDAANFNPRAYMITTVSSGGDDMNFAFYIGPFDGTGEFLIIETRLAGSDAVIAQSVGEVPITSWHHVAFTYDGSNIRFYIDGVLDDTDAYSTAFPTGGAMTFEVGTRDGITSNIVLFDGSIVFPFYATAVYSADEILEAMWFPERILKSPEVILGSWGDSPEDDFTGNGLTGTITAPTAVEYEGPPIAFGGGLPL